MDITQVSSENFFRAHLIHYEVQKMKKTKQILLAIALVAGMMQCNIVYDESLAPADDGTGQTANPATDDGTGQTANPATVTLDTTFGTNGKVTTAIGSGNDGATSLTIDGNGKIVVAGTSNNGSNYGRNNDFALARYNADGSLDTSFDADGNVTTAIESGDDFAYDLAIDGNGKIVVAGAIYGKFALARYNANGSLDTSFGTGGKLTTDIGSGDDFAYDLAIDGNGKIVVAGFSYNGCNKDFALARYLP